MLPIKEYYFSVVQSSTSEGASGTPIEVATASEMDALLTTNNVGKIYLYKGVTNETYTNGELYQVVEEV